MVLKMHLTPEGDIDLKWLFHSSKFPIYIWNSPPLDFRLVHAGMVPVILSSQAYYISRVLLLWDRVFPFALPDDRHLVQTLGIENFDATQRDDLASFDPQAEFFLDLLTETAGAIFDGILQPPPEWGDFFGKSLDPMTREDHFRSQLSQINQFLHQVAWETHDMPDFQFNMYYWDGEASISLAYGTGTKLLVALVAVAVPRSEFVEMLSSLSVLQQDNDQLIGKWQREMQLAKEEWKRLRKARPQ